MFSMLSTIKTITIISLSSTLLMACGADIESQLPDTVDTVNETVTGAVADTSASTVSTTTTNSTDEQVEISPITDTLTEVVEEQATPLVANNPSKAESTNETSTPTTKSLRLAWFAPDQRANGSGMHLNELSGYEIQYRKVGETIFTSTIINNPEIVEHTLMDLELGDYEIKMAAFDTDNHYGEFSDIAKITL